MKLLTRVLAASSALLAIAAALPAQGRVHTVDDGKPYCGAVWHLDVSAGGSVQEQLEITDGLNGFENALDDGDAFGSSVATIGDVDGNGTTDLAVGARDDDTGGNYRGAVWILFREADGSVASRRAIRSGDVPLPDQAQFGSALAFLGDLDGDGRSELAVGAPGSAVGGALWILSLEADGSVALSTLVTEGRSGFGGNLDSGDGVGRSLAAIGDLDGDGVPDLAAGAPYDNDGGYASGALWILFLNEDATVKAHLKISRTSGGGSGGLNGDLMGTSVCPLGDLDDDGVVDLALGAALSRRPGESGGVGILFLNANGTVRAKQLISSSGLSGPINRGFGSAVAPLGDLDDDGIEDLAVGAPTTGTGSVFVLFLNADGTVKAQTRLDSSIAGLARDDRLGSSLAALGDVDGDGRADLAVGAMGRSGIGNADFTDLQTAVNAAANGDTLLLRRGTYQATVSAKSLTILGHVAGTVRAGLVVQGLTASQTVALKRLGGGFTLADNAGLIWIDECTVLAFDRPALTASDCDRVVLVRSTFESYSWQDHGWIPPDAPAGVELMGSSTLHAYDCTVRGSGGGLSYVGFPVYYIAQDGGAGLLASSAVSSVFLSRCTVSGGNGFWSYPLDDQPYCTAGGPGLQTVSEAVVLDSVLTGGTGGRDGNGPCAPDGRRTVGPVNFLAGEGLSLTMSQLGREREDVTFTFQGPPFCPVQLIGSPMAHATFFPALRGSLLVGVPRAMKFMGFTDDTGRLEVVHSIGLLPPSSDIRRVYLQPFYLESGRATLGAGALYLVLDERF